MWLQYPESVTLVRHGESVGNVIAGMTKRNDDRYYDDHFKGIHSSKWVLSKQGVRQAQITGEYLRETHGNFSLCYSSDYTRAFQTLTEFGFPDDQETRVDMLLAERDWGDFEQYTHAERMTRYAASLRLKQTDPLYWRPPNGESMRDVMLRLHIFRDSLRRDFSYDHRSSALVVLSR